MSDYSLRIARRRVKIYRDRDKDLMSQHREAMECRDCEEFLNSGIEAYKWLKQADEILREAARQGLGVPEEAVEVLAKLFRRWLVPCDRAIQMIQVQKAKGFSVKNVDDFMAACEYVRRQVQRQEDYEALDEVMQGTSFDIGFWEEAARVRSEQH